jgi:hypothetical protein
MAREEQPKAGNAIRSAAGSVPSAEQLALASPKRKSTEPSQGPVKKRFSRQMSIVDLPAAQEEQEQQVQAQQVHQQRQQQCSSSLRRRSAPDLNISTAADLGSSSSSSSSSSDESVAGSPAPRTNLSGIWIRTRSLNWEALLMFSGMSKQHVSANTHTQAALMLHVSAVEAALQAARLFYFMLQPAATALLMLVIPCTSMYNFAVFCYRWS